MIASTNPSLEKADFEKLLDDTVFSIHSLVKEGKVEIEKLKGSDLEPFIEDVMNESSEGTPFEGTIVRHGGLKFPDIVANNFFGVEVKSTTKDHWTTTGNSVLESTRVPGVERVYMMFGKLHNPIEFKVRPYAECLSEIVVTHSPRYLIDMNLPAGQTIFDKIGMDYDTLRLHNPPIKPVLDYYTAQLKPGEEVWWLNNSAPSKVIFRFFSSLSDVEKAELLTEAHALFPELLGNQQTKYNRVTSWLVREKNIICPNIRDSFSAGGKVTIKTRKHSYVIVPQVVARTLDKLSDIHRILGYYDKVNLIKSWGAGTTKKTKFNNWVMITSSHTTGLPSGITFSDLVEDKLST